VEIATSTATRWTHSELGPLADGTLAVAQPMRYPTWDRRNGRPRELTGLIYRPRTGTRHPVLICLPGGDGQVRDRFDPLLQTLARELGYAIVVPTLRGSAGQGRGFAALDDGALRNDTLRDVGALLVWIGMQSDLDRDRMAILGTGPAAALAMDSLAQYGDRLQRAILIDGAAGETPVQVIRKPLLIVQGFDAAPMPVGTAEQLLWKLRNGGGDAALISAGSAAQPIGSTTAQAVRTAVAQFLQPLASGR
jgi:dienelactone hydrolase